MPAYVDIPMLNPVAFYEKGFTNDARYNYPHPDDYLNREQSQSWHFTREYFQKWQTSDTIKIQVLASISPVVANLKRWNVDGVPVSTVSGLVMTTTLVSPGFDVYEVTIPLTGLSEDTYYLELVVGSGGSAKTFISEPMYIKAKHEGTMLFEYTNDRNDYDVIFKRIISGQVDYLEYSLRTEAYIDDFAPMNQSMLYKDHSFNSRILKAFSFRQFKLYLGDAVGVADWVADRVNRIFDCATVTIDGKAFTRVESNRLEPQRSKPYQHAAWTMDIVEAKNRKSKRWEPAAGTGGLTVVYNIEGRAFGAQNAPAGSNIIQVTSTTD